MDNPSTPLATENPPPDEVVYTQNLARRLQAKITKDYPTGLMRRDAHPKMHGLVKAEFTVEPDLPPALRIGLFETPATYKAWIRFSNQNGTIQADIKGDIRGMAIKLMNVPGKKILEEEQDEQTHDFIVISSNVFVTADVREFDGLIKALTTNFLSVAWFFLTHWRVGWNLRKSMVKFANPLQIRYFSTTPYLLGDSAVKYAATPHVTSADAIPSTPADDYLREAMVRQLSKDDAVFDFHVQLQTDAEMMPIEDPGKEWPESVSPFRKVATIRIPQQAFDDEGQREFGENLSYTPWHALPAHRPLGGINRARKIVYDAISKFRHQRNNVPRKEPTGWEISTG
jgi:hypothetical protein